MLGLKPGLTKEQARAKYNAAKAGITATYDLATFQKFFPTTESLVQFWHDVKYLSWPEFYAQSPFDKIEDIAYKVINQVISPSNINFMLSELNADYEWRRKDALNKLKILHHYQPSIIPEKLAPYLSA